MRVGIAICASFLGLLVGGPLIGALAAMLAPIGLGVVQSLLPSS